LQKWYFSPVEKSQMNIQGRILVPARIQLLSGKDIGEMQVPITVFFDGEEDHRGIISLSMQPDNELSRHSNRKHGQNDGPHVPGCKHSPKMNIMLIEWKKSSKGASFAIRVAIGRIEPSAWEEAGAIEKDIILA
jgi:hypothetical protein